MSAMSLTTDGKHITCDGEGCTERAAVPVSLVANERSTPRPADAAIRWLYVLRQGQAYHYCPRCAQQYLSPRTSAEFG